MAKVISLREEIGQAPSLDDRIADAFESELTSAALAELLREVQETSEAAKAESKAASAVALDPRLRPADVADARQKMQDADFRSTRLDRAAEELAGVLEKAKRMEATQAGELEYQAAKAERDQLANDLQEYTALAEKIARLVTRLAANDARLQGANKGRSAEQWLYSAEVIARDGPLNWHVSPRFDFPTLIHGVRLPTFTYTGGQAYLWPPRANY